MRRLAFLGWLGLSLGCPATSGPGPVASAVSPDATPQPDDDDGLASALAQAKVGVDDPSLAELLVEQWAFQLADQPEFATSLGVRDYDDRLAEVGEAALRRRQAKGQAFLARAEAIASAGSSSARDRITVNLFMVGQRSALERTRCRYEAWNVSAHGNPLDRYGELGTHFELRKVEDAEHLLERYRAVGGRIDAHATLLRQGLADGLVGNAESLRRVQVMFDDQLARDVSSWAMLDVIERFPASWPARERERLSQAFTEVVSNQVAPALRRYRDLVVEVLLPRARGDEAVGLGSLPLGAECYAAMVRNYTTLPLSPREIHEVGLAEVARIDAEIAALGRTALGTATLADTLSRLRSDPSLYFGTADEVESAAIEALRLAKAKMKDYFGRLPRADCVVARVPDYKAPFTTIAYYDQPHTDGTKPGQYYVNVLEPRTRPRYEARVLAVHESIPGHHLQIAIAQELGALPAFRRHEGYTAFVEGWALYTERLADEMGMYDDDLDRLGMLSFDAWRAGRLVVDTGIHDLGWSRAQAVAFLTEHTALAPNNIDNEVDRYISWPGQALGYKIGQLEIWALRRAAERELGDGFDLRLFHDAVLTSGAVTLPVLRAQVESWVADRRAGG